MGFATFYEADGSLIHYSIDELDWLANDRPFVPLSQLSTPGIPSGVLVEVLENLKLDASLPRSGHQIFKLTIDPRNQVYVTKSGPVEPELILRASQPQSAQGYDHQKFHKKMFVEACVLRYVALHNIRVPKLHFVCCDIGLYDDCCGLPTKSWNQKFDFVDTDRAPFMVMERLRGATDEWCINKWKLTKDQKVCR